MVLPKEGEADLYDVKVGVVAEDPFYFDVATVTLGRMLEGSSGTASFFFDLEATAMPGVYEIDLVLSYQPEFGSRISFTRTATVKIVEVPDDPFGPILVETSPSPLYEGSPYAKVNIDFALASVGLGLVFNLSVSLAPPGDM